MKALLEILTLTTNYLKQRGFKNPRRQAEDLISDALNIQRLNLYLDFDRPLNEAELDRCRQYLMRRAKGEPLQYIKGEIEFYGCRICLNQDVLIPRQETEILVDKIVKELETENLTGKSLWDVCCGSGCIGIALKKKFPQLRVTLSDYSVKALEMAKKNAEINEVEIQFLQGDLMHPFLGNKTSYFICNPPYIAEHEFPHLDSEVRDYEPYSALVSGPTGLEMYQKLAFQLKEFLDPVGKAWFEIGSLQGPSVNEIFKQAGWKTCKVEKDWSGKDRFFFLENE